MRRHWVSLATLLVLGPAALAQQGAGAGLGRPAAAAPPAATAPAPANPVLDAHLANWEKRMSDVQTLVTQLRRIQVDKGFGSTDTFEGTAQYMRPNLALLQMSKNKGKPEEYEKYICTGTYVYTFIPQQKIIRAYELPKPKAGAGGVGDDNVLSLLFTIRAADAKARYDLSLEKEDQYYVYIKILPKTPQDKSDFTQARLVLNRETYLPRELWFVSFNGDEVKWDIPRIDTNVKVDRQQFEKPAVPTGWKLEMNPQPTVVRPKQP